MEGYDSEGKALSIRKAFWGKPTPHLVAFHLAWFSFMVAFLSSFAPAALITTIKDDLKLSKAQIANSNVAAVMGGVAARLFIGKFMDTYGPRHAFLICLWGTVPFIFGISAVKSFAGYAACRFFIAMSLAAVIPCIQWTTNMFNVGVVGTANAIVGGWGNLGGGLTHIVMPLFFDSLVKLGHVKTEAWRLAFYLPAALHLFAGAAVFLFGQDHPDGRTAAVKKADGGKKNDMTWPAWRAALLNYRTWALTAVYAVTFGTEIAVDNILSKFYQNHFKLSQTVGGGIAAVSGLLNLFSRPSGGVVSDLVSARGGHRHRITWLFVTTLAAGVCMVLFGALPLGLAPATVLMVLFSIFYEQACGATYALVPLVSNRSPGLVSGFVSSGGTAGAALWNGFVFKSQAQNGFWHMGAIIASVSLACLIIYWPAWGGILIKPTPYATEDEYYASEWTPEERARGLHQRSLRFAREASIHGGSQHGSRHGGKPLSRSASKVSLGSLGKAGPGDDSARGAKVAAEAAVAAKL